MFFSIMTSKEKAIVGVSVPVALLCAVVGGTECSKAMREIMIVKEIRESAEEQTKAFDGQTGLKAGSCELKGVKRVKPPTSDAPKNLKSDSLHPLRGFWNGYDKNSISALPGVNSPYLDAYYVQFQCGEMVIQCMRDHWEKEFGCGWTLGDGLFK